MGRSRRCPLRPRQTAARSGGETAASLNSSRSSGLRCSPGCSARWFRPDLRVDPVTPGVADVGLQAGPRGQGAAPDPVRLDHDPRPGPSARRGAERPGQHAQWLTDLLTRLLVGTWKTTRDTGDARLDLRLVSETRRNIGDSTRRMPYGYNRDCWRSPCSHQEMPMTVERRRHVAEPWGAAIWAPRSIVAGRGTGGREFQRYQRFWCDLPCNMCS